MAKNRGFPEFKKGEWNKAMNNVHKSRLKVKKKNNKKVDKGIIKKFAKRLDEKAIEHKNKKT